ncbi:MAG: FAD-dependent oxidoreductase, partial [Actinomycetaceae bacterium]
LDEVGVIDEFLAVGLVARYFDFWDKSAKELVARFDHEALSGLTRHPYVVQTEQHKLVRIALRMLADMPGVEVRLGCRFESLEQDLSGVRAVVSAAGRRETLSAHWLIACDGGRSAVRKHLGIEFEGYTWPERFIVLTSTFDFGAALGCSYRAYMADPGEWTNLFKVPGDDMAGRWRAVLPTGVDESDDEALSDEAAARRLASVWPEAGVDQLVHRKIYRVHQRVAARFRSGRVFLAGDAAHVNNPIGGLGLNCGIHDVMELVGALEQYAARSDESLLDGYDTRRREINIQYVQNQTVTNKRRLEEKDPEVRKQRLDELRATAADPERHLAYLRRSSLLDSVGERSAAG